MFDFVTLIERLWPKNPFGGIDKEGDLYKFFEGMAESMQDVYDAADSVAHIRDPRLTANLSDLEREYGIVPDTSLSDAVRRQMLAHVKYHIPNSASWQHLQNALIDAGFSLTVTPNNPVVNPANVSGGAGDLLVNGPIYISQTPAVYMCVGSSIAYVGHSRAYTGYYLFDNKTEKSYTIPNAVMNYWVFPFVFWVGGSASNWTSSPAVALANIDSQRRTQLETLILKYKPSYTWCVMRINWT